MLFFHLKQHFFRFQQFPPADDTEYFLRRFVLAFNVHFNRFQKLLNIELVGHQVSDDFSLGILRPPQLYAVASFSDQRQAERSDPLLQLVKIVADRCRRHLQVIGDCIKFDRLSRFKHRA